LRARWLQWLFKPIVVVLLIPIVGCGGLLGLLLLDSALHRIPANVIRAVRVQGGLAPLPPSTTDLRTDGWASIFSSGRYIRFKAMPQEIERFLAASPGLKGVRPERFSPRHRYLPYPGTTRFESVEQVGEYLHHKYFSPSSPAWYNPAIRTKGRRYEIPWHGPGYWGEVVVDDARHVVFIHTSYS
jgi:hypothetical protein